MMIVKRIWVMLGLSIWGLCNLVSIIILLKHDCFTKSAQYSHYKFWVRNFVLVAFSAIATALFTIIFMPVYLMQKVYKATERKNDG